MTRRIQAVAWWFVLMAGALPLVAQASMNLALDKGCLNCHGTPPKGKAPTLAELAARYASVEMTRLWSDNHRYRLWRQGQTLRQCVASLLIGLLIALYDVWMNGRLVGGGSDGYGVGVEVRRWCGVLVVVRRILRVYDAHVHSS